MLDLVKDNEPNSKFFYERPHLVSIDGQSPPVSRIQFFFIYWLYISKSTVYGNTYVLVQAPEIRMRRALDDKIYDLRVGGHPFPFVYDELRIIAEQCFKRG